MARKMVLLILLLTLLNYFVFAYQSAQEALVNEPFKGEMAYNEDSQVAIDPIKSKIESEILTFKAFNGLYNSTWFDMYVQKESRFILNRLYDQSFAKWLPAKILVGKAKQEQTYDLVSLIIYPMQAKEEHSLEVIWEVDKQNRWSITMINVLKSKRP
jgi:hypothetical protein